MTDPTPDPLAGDAEAPPPSPPSRRAFVHLPVAAFFVFDLAILLVAGRSLPSAIVFAGATSVLVGWVLDRRHRDALSRYEHRLRSQNHPPIGSNQQPDTPATPSITTGPGTGPSTGASTGASTPSTPSTPISPPVGSWANPSTSQRFRRRWDRSMPYAPRRGRRR